MTKWSEWKKGGWSMSLCSLLFAALPQETKVAKWVNILQDTSVSDATIWSVTLESSIMILEVSFTITFDVYGTGITYDDRQLTIMTCL
jgi:hypothetical protein